MRCVHICHEGAVNTYGHGGSGGVVAVDDGVLALARTLGRPIHCQDRRIGMIGSVDLHDDTTFLRGGRCEGKG